MAQPAHARKDADVARLRAAASSQPVASAAHLSCMGQHGESRMKNRVRQSRTLGSVRGEDGAATVPLNGHAAGNGGYGQGETYRCDRSSPTRSVT